MKSVPNQRLRWNTATLAVALALMFLSATAFAQNSPPIVDAGLDQSIFVGEAVALQGSATDPDGNVIVSYLWTVESAPEGSNPSFSNTAHPQSQFTADLPGEYVLSLVASDGIDTSAPDYVTITVAEVLPPVAVAQADVTSGPAPLTVNFDGSASVDPQGGTLAFDWSFGDGYISSEMSPTHTYVNSGVYTVILNVFDSLGQNDLDTIEIVVTTANQPPVASPTATPNSGFAPLNVQFHANASDPDGDALTYAWDFGDGGTSSVADPQHVYESPGPYTAWLTVSDGREEVSASLTIVVNPAMEISVESAEVKYKGPKSSMGKVELLATFTMDMPDPNNVISVDFDGIQLCSAPFMSFEPSNNNPNVYKLRDHHLFVMLDFDRNLLVVICRNLSLGTLDNTNGVDVKLFVGSAVAVENIVLQEAQGNKLEYHSTE